MSGLVGAFSRAGDRLDGSTLEAMLETIDHRGPDGTAAWHDGPIGLGHAHFVTTPEARSATWPAHGSGPDGELVLIADARIDNRRELGRRLDLAPSETVTDGELVLEAYRRWGTDCPRHLVGAFAFALWDDGRRRLVCARDHVGIKPLYYHLDDDLALVGSEPKAVFATDEVPRGIDETAIGDFLAYHLADTARTVHTAVRRLPPGHTLTVDREGATLQRYWTLDPSRSLSFPSPAAAVEAFRERFERAVRCRLRTSEPLGSMLSGGLDSSAIVRTARPMLENANRGPLHTYSVVFDRIAEADERTYLDTVLAVDGLEPHRIVGDSLSPLADLDDRLDRFDGPFDPYLQHITWAVYRHAGADVRVLLDGYDGDTVVSHGIGRLAELWRSGRWPILARELARLTPSWSDRVALLRDHAIGPSVPGPVRELYRRWSDGRDPIERANPTIDPAFAARIDLAERLRPAPPPTTARERQYRLLTDGKITRVLELADHAAATFGLEPRYPFLDRRLMEFCLALPSEYKLRNGWTRWVLRAATAGVLPDAVRWRRGKADLHPYFVRALADVDAIDRLADGRQTQSLGRYLDHASIRRERERLASEQSTTAATALARAVVLDEWLK